MKKINFTVIGLVLALILVLTANVLILVRYRQDATNYENKIANLQTEVLNQRTQKNTIRNLWEEQAASSDKLIIAQSNLFNRIEEYKLEIKRSIRFVNSNPELLSTVNEERLKNTQLDLETEGANVEDKSKESTAVKDNAKQVIDALYLNTGEEQKNRANPRNDTSD